MHLRRCPSRPRADEPARAFTLFELLVVLVIIAIAAALVVPQAMSGSDLRALSAARTLMADLEYAQSQAVVTQSQVTVTFDQAGNSYQLSNQSQTLIHPISKKDYVVDFDSSESLRGVSIAAVNFNGGATVTFDALGAPDPAGFVDLAAGPHTYRVTVAPVTGRVSVAKVP